MKVADLFCGVGGLSQGFVWAGCKIALGIEHDPEIALSYKKNHPDTDVYVNDIRNLDFKEIHQKHPIIDIVIGGPPCQGFSQKGKRLNLEDPRNFLFQSFVDFVAEFSPKYFVLENVPEIITTSGGFFCNEIISAFKQIRCIECRRFRSSTGQTPRRLHRQAWRSVYRIAASLRPTQHHQRRDIRPAVHRIRLRIRNQRL